LYNQGTTPPIVLCCRRYNLEVLQTIKWLGKNVIRINELVKLFSIQTQFFYEISLTFPLFY